MHAPAFIIAFISAFLLNFIVQYISVSIIKTNYSFFRFFGFIYLTKTQLSYPDNAAFGLLLISVFLIPFILKLLYDLIKNTLPHVPVLPFFAAAGMFYGSLAGNLITYLKEGKIIKTIIVEHSIFESDYYTLSGLLFFISIGIFMGYILNIISKETHKLDRHLSVWQRISFPLIILGLVLFHMTFLKYSDRTSNILLWATEIISFLLLDTYTHKKIKQERAHAQSRLNRLLIAQAH